MLGHETNTNDRKQLCESEESQTLNSLLANMIASKRMGHSGMATATVLKFMQKTAEDETLRQQLEKLLGVGDGNISSEADLDPAESAALKGERAPVVAEFAALNGYDFSVDELVTVVDAFQKHQAGEMSDDAFASLIGVPATVGGGGQDLVGVTKVKRWFMKTYLGY